MKIAIDKLSTERHHEQEVLCEAEPVHDVGQNKYNETIEDDWVSSQLLP